MDGICADSSPDYLTLHCDTVIRTLIQPYIATVPELEDFMSRLKSYERTMVVRKYIFCTFSTRKYLFMGSLFLAIKLVRAYTYDENS